MGMLDGQCPKGRLRTDLYPQKYGRKFAVFFLDRVLPKVGLNEDQFMGGIGNTTYAEYDSEPGDKNKIHYMVHLINDDDRTKNMFSTDKKGPLADETQHPEQLRISKYLVWRFVS